MAPTSYAQRPCREPLFDINPQTDVNFEIFNADRARDIRAGRRWLVLLAAPTRLFARGLAYWAVLYELRSVPARGGYDAVHRK
jgi:hypothetical protein